MNDVFTPYETGLTHLLRRLGQDHPRYAEALTLQSRLLENIAQARRYGDTETRRAERAQIVEQLNTLALDALGTTFNDLCAVQEPPPPISQPAPGARSVQIGGNAQGNIIVTGDRNVINVAPGESEGGSNSSPVYARTPASPTVVCPRCRLESPADARRCRNCGYEFENKE